MENNGSIIDKEYGLHLFQECSLISLERIGLCIVCKGACLGYGNEGNMKLKNNGHPGKICVTWLSLGQLCPVLCWQSIALWMKMCADTVSFTNKAANRGYNIGYIIVTMYFVFQCISVSMLQSSCDFLCYRSSRR